jgi:hypothetical protein
MKDFLGLLAEKKLLMNISEQKNYVRQKKTRHFCRVNFSLGPRGPRLPEPVFLS